MELNNLPIVLNSNEADMIRFAKFPTECKECVDMLRNKIKKAEQLQWEMIYKSIQEK